MEGRTDFENLTPAILDKINLKKLKFNRLYLSRACKCAVNKGFSNN